MKHFTILAIFMTLILGSTFAGTIDAELAKQMKENPLGSFHVIAFLKGKEAPQEVIKNFQIRGDKFQVAQQVAQLYKNETERHFHWFYKMFANKVKKIRKHPLIQAVSFETKARIIFAISRLKYIKKITLYKKELTKPNDLFLTPEYYKLRKEVSFSGTTTDKALSYKKLENRADINYEKIINILKDVYAFIEKNQPVVNTSIDQACAIPEGITNWQQMAGWREKHTNQYIITYKNLYGMTVVKIVVRVHFFYNGNYEDKGHYITCATTSLDDMYVMWGYTLNATVKVPDSGIVNMGTTENPIAGMKMFVKWHVKNIINQSQGNITFSLDGKGNVSSY